jgi:hypothetical protein
MKLPQMTDGARALVDNTLVTLGKKTKKLFTDELNREMKLTFTTDHQILNSGDIIRVCNTLKIAPHEN